MLFILQIWHRGSLEVTQSRSNSKKVINVPFQRWAKNDYNDDDFVLEKHVKDLLFTQNIYFVFMKINVFRTTNEVVFV